MNAELEHLMSEAVRSQLVADRPVGIYVSGGIDSSVIYALAEGPANRHLTLTARLNDADVRAEGIEDDGRWADQLLARHPEDRRASLRLSPDLYSHYPSLIWHMDEPVADPAIVPSYLLAKRARELGAVVMLSGMGGDEVFGGYRRYALAASWQTLSRAGRPASGAMESLAAWGQAASSPSTRRWATYLERLAGALREDWPLAYAGVTGHITPAEVDRLAGDGWREGLAAKMRRTLQGWEETSRLTQMQRLDLKGFLASHNLLYADKSSMAASVEVRVPLLDHRVVEAAFRLADGERASLRCLKPWLRRFCRRLVGPEIASRPKAGFTMPVRAWLEQPQLRDEVAARLRGERLASVVNADAVAAILQSHIAGRRDNTWKLWTLLTLDLWLERFKAV
jgi:asparagine synthase (glutamine-hydrolysing)